MSEPNLWSKGLINERKSGLKLYKRIIQRIQNLMTFESTWEIWRAEISKKTRENEWERLHPNWLKAPVRLTGFWMISNNHSIYTRSIQDTHFHNPVLTFLVRTLQDSRQDVRNESYSNPSLPCWLKWRNTPRYVYIFSRKTNELNRISPTQNEQKRLQSALQMKWRRRREDDEDDATYEYICLKSGNIISPEEYTTAFEHYIAQSKVYVLLSRFFNFNCNTRTNEHTHSHVSAKTQGRWTRMTKIALCREKTFEKISNELTKLSIQMNRIRTEYTE